MNNCKKIVITGASGFLGCNLVERLKDDERYEVYALSSKPEALKKKIGGVNVDFIHKDTLNAEFLKDSIVINCAYPRNSIGTEIANGLKYIQGVFESAVKNDAAAILNISSQSVYSQQRTETATEETPVSLESSYAVGKYAVELMLESICKGSRTKYTSLRMASLIGPGFNQRIVNRFAIKMLQREQITVVRQDKYIGFLDIRDAVEAVMSIIMTPSVYWKPVYNVGNEKGYTVEQIYEVLASMLRDKIVVENPIIEKGSDSSTTAVSYSRLHEDTGFVPKVDLEGSINNILAQLDYINDVH